MGNDGGRPLWMHVGPVLLLNLWLGDWSIDILTCIDLDFSLNDTWYRSTYDSWSVNPSFGVSPLILYCTAITRDLLFLWQQNFFMQRLRHTYRILQAFGCFLAWETRNVNIPALNDSKYIGKFSFLVYFPLLLLLAPVHGIDMSGLDSTGLLWKLTSRCCCQRTTPRWCVLCTVHRQQRVLISIRSLIHELGLPPKIETTTYKF